jgi:hypothetical protein
MLLDIVLLRTFVAVVEAKGFTRAAGCVNLTQSAVSLHIKRLEEQIGRRLFDRAAPKLALTSDGEILLSYARRILALEEEVKTRLGHPEPEGLIRFGAPEYFDPGTLASLLRDGVGVLSARTTPSDEAVRALWVESPYYQYFCGEEFFQHELPLDRSSMTNWRNRMGEERLRALLQESLSVATRTGAMKPSDLARVVIDTTVQPKNVTLPTLHMTSTCLGLRKGSLGCRGYAICPSTAHSRIQRHPA